MKVLRILLLMLTLPVVGYGQIYVDGALIDTLNTPYCQLICTNATGFTNTRVKIDYGQPFVNNLLGRQKITGANKEAITFKSSIDALNFMSKQGWAVVSSHVTSTESGDYGTFIYLLQRKKSFVFRQD